MFLERMGFDKSDRVVIIHVDDMGSSHSANIAAFECFDHGIASCGSVLSPSPWLMEVARRCRSKGESKEKSYDIGVHLTLTSEYDDYRWRPVSTADPGTGLIDHEGYMWKTSRDAVINVKSQAAKKEMTAQIKLALTNGIDVTHIDSHMGTVIHPKFVNDYLAVAKEFEIPAFIPRLTDELLTTYGSTEYREFFARLQSSLDGSGYPVIDHLVAYIQHHGENNTAYYKKVIDSLKPGLTHLLIHPAKSSPELTALTENGTRQRDHDAFTDPFLRDHINNSGVKIIGYRDIRKYLRKMN